jgi:hypothetical protein
MRAGFDLLKIVHAFSGPETVLFAFPEVAASPRDVSFSRSLYNEKIQSVGRTLPVPMDLKSTINLPKTDFPMKASLPQNEPKMLERWEQMGSTSASARPAREADLRPARRAALHQRTDPPGHGDEQVP